jgi:hypothetical protein
MLFCFLLISGFRKPELGLTIANNQGKAMKNNVLRESLKPEAGQPMTSGFQQESLK